MIVFSLKAETVLVLVNVLFIPSTAARLEETLQRLYSVCDNAKGVGGMVQQTRSCNPPEACCGVVSECLIW